ncbi:TatD family like protein, partial [Aduncisulcus paluster]
MKSCLEDKYSLEAGLEAGIVSMGLTHSRKYDFESSSISNESYSGDFSEVQHIIDDDSKPVDGTPVIGCILSDKDTILASTRLQDDLREDFKDYILEAKWERCGDERYPILPYTSHKQAIRTSIRLPVLSNPQNIIQLDECFEGCGKASFFAFSVLLAFHQTIQSILICTLFGKTDIFDSSSPPKYLNITFYTSKGDSIVKHYYFSNKEGYNWYSLPVNVPNVTHFEVICKESIHGAAWCQINSIQIILSEDEQCQCQSGEESEIHDRCPSFKSFCGSKHLISQVSSLLPSISTSLESTSFMLSYLEDEFFQRIISPPFRWNRVVQLFSTSIIRSLSYSDPFQSLFESSIIRNDPRLSCSVNVNKKLLDGEFVQDMGSNTLWSCIQDCLSISFRSLHIPFDYPQNIHSLCFRTDYLKNYPPKLLGISLKTREGIAFSRICSFEMLSGKLIVANREHIVAYGEMGLDFDRLHFAPKQAQLLAFDAQLKLAEELDLPLFLHSRAAESDFLRLLGKYKFPRKGVVHSFTGSAAERDAILKLGFDIGVNGCSLKTEENLRVVRDIPLDRLHLETDAPWCEIRPSHASYKYVKTRFPAKKKEKFVMGQLVKSRNEVCCIIQVAEVISGLLDISMD